MTKKPTYEELEQRVKELEKEVSKRKRAQEELRESEERLKTVVNNVNDVIFQLSPLGLIQYVSPKVEEIYGYKPEELIGKHLRKTTPVSEVPKALETLKRVLSGKTVENLEINQLDSRGKIIPMEINGTPVKKGGKIIAAQGVMRDISERKRAEEALRKAHDELERRVEERTAELKKANEELQTEITERKRAEKELRDSREQLRNLSTYLQSVREQERTLIAGEIHDDLGQSLTALKMDIYWLAKRLPKDQKPLLEKLEAMEKFTGTTLKTVQRISTELRPSLLDHLGLVTTIEWQAEEFQNRTGIKYKLTIDPEDITLDEKLSTSIFRIFQETLTNVARHARATRVEVSLKEKAGTLELKVRDNGKGITKEQISDPKSFGLMGIRERVHPWGGQVKISGIEGKGTTVMVRIPIEKKGKPDDKDIHS